MHINHGISTINEEVLVDVVEIDNDTANTLISYGKGEASDGKVSEKKDRSVGLEKSEVKVKRRKGK